MPPGRRLRVKLFAPRVHTLKGTAMSATLQPVDVNGTVIWVEVTDTPIVSPPRAVGKFAETAAQDTAQNVLDAVGKVDVARTLNALVTPIHQGLASLAPQEVTIELGIGIKGEVGIFVASSEGNASVKITAKWTFAGDKA